jgi:uncharacterized phage protein gp47/JayE
MRPIPTIQELRETLANDFKSKLNLLSNNLKKFLDAFSIVESAKFKLLYLYLQDLQNNIFPDTADLEANGGTLERQGRIYLNRNPRPATVGTFELSVTGESGSVLRSGLTFKSNENSLSPGQLYVLDLEYTMTGTDDVIEVRSLGTGSEFDLNIDDELTITEPVIGVNQLVTVSDVISQPKNGEDIESYRQAILDAIQLEPQGGSKTDYRLWSSDAQGVKKVYPYVKNGDAGTVQVYVEATDGDGVPSSGLISEVEEVIEFDPDESKPLNERGRRPIQATIEVLPIVLIPVTVTITGLSQDTPSIRSAIQNNIELYLSSVRPYISGADLARNRNDILYEARLQSVATDVLENSNFFTGFAITVNGNSVSSYQFDLGNIPNLVTPITYN